MEDLELDVEFNDYEDATLFAQARLGENTRTFLATELGQYLIGVAKQEIEDAAFELLEVPVWRKRKIRKLQDKAALARNFVVWINEVIIAGDNAHQNLIMKQDNQ